MDEHMNQVVVVRDSTGSTTEGVYMGVEEFGGLYWVMLDDSQQINFQNAETSDGSVKEYEAWSIGGRNRIALHLMVGIHKSHLPQKAKPRRGR